MSKSNQLVPRYDPQASDAFKYEIKGATSGKNPDSNGRFFVVSDELKSALSMTNNKDPEREEEKVGEETSDPFTEHFFVQKNDARLDQDPFFDEKFAKKSADMRKQMTISLRKKKHAAKNRKAGRIPVPPKKKNTVEKKKKK